MGGVTRYLRDMLSGVRHEFKEYRERSQMACRSDKVCNSNSISIDRNHELKRGYQYRFDQRWLHSDMRCWIFVFSHLLHTNKHCDKHIYKQTRRHNTAIRYINRKRNRTLLPSYPLSEKLIDWRCSYEY